MTKVEELREKVLGNYPKIATTQKGMQRTIDIIETVDALIVSAYEAEREKIRNWVESDAPISDEGVPYTELLSYLAPKEADNDR